MAEAVTDNSIDVDGHGRTDWKNTENLMAWGQHRHLNSLQDHVTDPKAIFQSSRVLTTLENLTKGNYFSKIPSSDDQI